jgi:hypothetical protein
VLKSDKLPYLFTVLIALVTYSVTKVADRLDEMPIIEYSIVKQSGSKDGDNSMNIVLTNLSSQKVLTDLVFLVHAEGPIKQWGVQVGPPLTIFGGYNEPFGRELTPSPDEKFKTFKIKGLRPYCPVTLSVIVKGSDRLSLSYPYTDELFRLMPRGLQTIIVRHELDILVALVGMSLLLLIMYALFLGRSGVPAHSQSGANKRTGSAA